MMLRIVASTVLVCIICSVVEAFVPCQNVRCFRTTSVSGFMVGQQQGSEAEDAERMKAKAEELREQIRRMEQQIGDKRRNRNEEYMPEEPPLEKKKKEPRVLVVGANGRLGSMVCRYLLRNYPETKVLAAVHYVNEESLTSRGWGRLSYEVGAEDGVGSIGPAWSAEDRTATFQYSDEMKDYNLQNIRVLDVELLDPVQCDTITQDVDAVVWCATDFNGNQPRAVSGLNLAFLFRAVADPTKGRVEIEGLRNILTGLLRNKQQQRGDASSTTDVVLVSTAPKAFRDVETPFGTFNGLKREGEQLLKNEFPSLTSTVLQMCRYEDNFVQESLEVMLDDPLEEDEDVEVDRRRINRRDAARAASEALFNNDIRGKTVQVWTAKRGRG